MEANGIPEFTGGISADMAVLAGLLRQEVRITPGRAAPYFDDFSIGVNDGLSMLVTLPWDCDPQEEPTAIAEYSLDGVIAELERIEDRYWELETGNDRTIDPQQLAALDQEVLEVFSRVGMQDTRSSLTTGVHVRFDGDTARPRWSLFIQNEALRKLVCSTDGAAICAELFQKDTQKGGIPQGAFMRHLSPYAPLGLAVPRAVLQLRAQCLDPDAIFLAHRGMVLRAAAPEELWNHYTAVVRKISDTVHARSRKLPWLFQGTGELLPESLAEGAVGAVRQCLGEDLDVRFWDSSREGILRKAISSADLLEAAAAGFPDHRTACLGGGVPMLVPLSAADSAAVIGQRIREAWDAYRKQYSEETPLRLNGQPHRPRLVVLRGLGVITAVPDPDLAQPAYAALAETFSVLEGTRAFGGMRPVAHPEALALLASPLRCQVPRAISRGTFGAAPEPVAEDDDLDAEDADTEDMGEGTEPPPLRPPPVP